MTTPVFSTKGVLITAVSVGALGMLWWAFPGAHPYLLWLVVLLALGMLLLGWPKVQQQWDTILKGG